MPYRILCKCNNQEIELVFFRGYKKYLNQILPIGQTRIISGKLEKFNNKYQIVHPESISFIEDLPYVHGLVAVYSLTRGLNITFYRKTIKQVLQNIPKIPEWIENEILENHKWKAWKDSILAIHRPKNINKNEIVKLRERLAFDEALAHQIRLLVLKEKIKEKESNKIKINHIGKQRIVEKLRFSLTDSQKKVLSEIEKDLEKKHPMQRLLQGDVGSGKTIVALISIISVAKKNYQTALMAPTEILALQHFNYFKNLIDDKNIKIVLLTSKIKEKEKILNQIENGKAHIIIGTHAIFQSKIKYKNLAYVIIDEQHRFGVNQKFELVSKGKNPHILTMTATPIPRTLALTMYGNMSISKITESPKNRKKIETISVSKKEIPKIISRLKDIVENNYNAFWICPLIEESEKLNLIAAEKRFNLLKKIFGDKIGLIHGKMDIEKKKLIIEDFKKKKIQILVSTTIIEVGIDVPSAKLIIIEESDRFGLSQLHQLRGRVGRSNVQSMCILLYNDNLTDIGKERIKVIKKHNDGFYIAEEDLKIRGFGEILGTRQTGYQLFKILDPFYDSKIFELASKEAEKIIKKRNKFSKEKKNIINNYLKIYNNHSSLKYISIT
tara:strand:- start:11 stop:1843 length:1833 start_codon:yes stop_codon:yes gene_type:complete